MVALDSGPNANVIPRKAVTGILLTEDAEPRILLAKRNETLRFMAGHHAFPGGRVDETEGSKHVIGADDDYHGTLIHAVAREVFEETGILCTRSEVPEYRLRRAAREKVLEDPSAFDPFLEEFDIRIHAEDFVPAGVWVTPAGLPIRFDTSYFIYRFKGEPYEEVIHGEIVALDWVTAAESRRLWRENKMLLPAPVAYTLQQLERFPYPEVLVPLRKTAHLDENRPLRIEVRPGINVLALKARPLAPATMTNCVIVGDEDLYVIDPGTDDEAEKEILKSQLDNLVALGGTVKAILLTHSHSDHHAAVPFVQEQYGAPVWAHAAVADRVPFAVDRFLEDDEVIRIVGSPQWRLRCIHTPGHDPGHLCFLEESSKILIAGDMIANGSTIIVSEQHGGSMDEYLRSLERMLKLDFVAMIPAHGMTFWEKPKKIIHDYIEHRLKREAKIREAIESGAKTVKELVAKAYDDVPKEVWPLAEHSLRAHLTRLNFVPEESS